MMDCMTIGTILDLGTWNKLLRILKDDDSCCEFAVVCQRRIMWALFSFATSFSPFLNIKNVTKTAHQSTRRQRARRVPAALACVRRFESNLTSQIACRAIFITDRIQQKSPWHAVGKAQTLMLLMTTSTHLQSSINQSPTIKKGKNKQRYRG